MPTNLTNAHKKGQRALAKLRRICEKALSEYETTIDTITLTEKARKAYYAKRSDYSSFNNDYYLRVGDLVRGIQSL